MQSNQMSDLTVKRRNYLKRVLLQWLFPLLYFTLPLSISYDWGLHQINLPSEPLIGLASIVLFILVDFKELVRSDFIRHPISLFSLVYLGWMSLTVPFSSDLVVSAKYGLVTLAHWWVFYIGFWYVNQIEKTTFEKWLGYYGFSFLAVILYTWYHHAQYDFRIDASVMVARPFYSDHALYSLAMCFFLFPAIAKFWTTGNFRLKVGYGILSLILVLGIYLSYSRAAWLSVLASLFLGGMIYFISIRFRALVLTLCVLGSAGALISAKWAMSSEITSVSKQGDWRNHIKSIANLTSDVSNLERINRYRCAWRMFLDRPLTGFGPGTFAQAYLPYQKIGEMTRLSVTSTQAPDGSVHPPGHGGGAHSEYFQALAESGIPGFLFWLSLIGTGILSGLKAVYFHTDSRERRLFLAMTVSLICFSIAGLFNNYLHNEKISLFFWIILAFFSNTAKKPSPDLKYHRRPETNYC